MSRFNPEKDMIDLTGKVAIVTGAKYIRILFDFVFNVSVFSFSVQELDIIQPNFLLVKGQRYI